MSRDPIGEPRYKRVMRSTFVPLFALIVSVGCSAGDPESVATADVSEVIADSAGSDSSSPETSAPVDAGVETGPVDAGKDTSVVDAPAPFDIVGTAAGECGKIKSVLTTTGSVVVEIPLSFGATDKFERAKLSPGGQRVFDAPNAGGSSKESEVMTYELLLHCDDAALLKTETEIKYGPAPDGGASTITDLLVTIGGVKLGVNPKRVFKPEPLTMTDTEVRDQMIKNFESVKASSARVLPEDKWAKQIVHVWVPNAFYFDAVKRVLPTIDDATKSNTIVLITRTTGGGFLYCDPDPAPGAECPPIK